MGLNVVKDKNKIRSNSTFNRKNRSVCWKEREEEDLQRTRLMSRGDSRVGVGRGKGRFSMSSGRPDCLSGKRWWWIWWIIAGFVVRWQMNLFFESGRPRYPLSSPICHVPFPLWSIFLFLFQNHLLDAIILYKGLRHRHHRDEKEKEPGKRSPRRVSL